MSEPYAAPFLRWAKTRPAVDYDLAASGLLPVSLAELLAGEPLTDWAEITGPAGDGFPPLREAIGSRYGVALDGVALAAGGAGANFLGCAACLAPGDEVLVEWPAYDPLLAAPRLLGAVTRRFARRPEAGFALEPEAVRAALTPRTRLIVLSHPHNPSGVAASAAALAEVGAAAGALGARVLVDEVYREAPLRAGSPAPPSAALLGPEFIVTSSLTKAFGLAGLRCGWVLAEPELAARARAARDAVDGSGVFLAEKLAALALRKIELLAARARTLLEANFQLVNEFMASRSDLDWRPPDAGTVTFPRRRDGADSGPLAERLLARYRTAIVPGRFFELPDHFRLSFGGPTESLTAGLAALGAALDGE